MDINEADPETKTTLAHVAAKQNAHEFLSKILKTLENQKINVDLRYLF
jgi:hypothetical protein